MAEIQSANPAFRRHVTAKAIRQPTCGSLVSVDEKLGCLNLFGHEKSLYNIDLTKLIYIMGDNP